MGKVNKITIEKIENGYQLEVTTKTATTTTWHVSIEEALLSMYLKRLCRIWDDDQSKVIKHFQKFMLKEENWINKTLKKFYKGKFKE